MRRITTFIVLVCLVGITKTTYAQISTTVIANTDNVEVTNAGSVTYNVLCNDTYISADSISVSVNTTASSGSVTDNGDGSVTYTNSGNYNDDTVTYTLTHTNSGNQSNGTLYVSNTSIAPTNNAPIATNDVDSAYMGLDVVVSVLSNDNDPDSDPMTVTSVTNGSNGTCTTNGTTITYTPTDTLWAGYDTATYIITDGNGGYDTATVYIQSGSSAQITTYNILSPYFGTQMTLASFSDFITINSNGTVSQTGSGPTYNNAVWDIQPNGNIYFNFNTITNSLTVTPFSVQITSTWYYGYSLGGTYDYIDY